MCHHKRTLFSCGHSEWKGLSKPCHLEEAFERGECDEGCAEMWSHGFNAVRIDDLCEPCTLAKEMIDHRFQAIKQRIQALRENIDSRLAVLGHGEEGDESDFEKDATPLNMDDVETLLNKLKEHDSPTTTTAVVGPLETSAEKAGEKGDDKANKQEGKEVDMPNKVGKGEEALIEVSDPKLRPFILPVMLGLPGWFRQLVHI